MLVDEIGNLEQEDQTGYDIVISAIEQPFFKILLNAGYDWDRIGTIEESIKSAGNVWEGYNPRTEEYVNMFDSGIIDPTKVTRVALENAASVAGMLLTTECVLADIPEENAAPMEGGMPGGMPGMM